MKLTFRQYLGIILIIILFTCLSAVLCSCKSTKNIDKAITSLQNIESVNIDSIVNVSVDSLKKHYLEKLNNTEADIVFSNCDTILKYRDTGSTRVINTVRYVPGKGIEASGMIGSFRLKESELLKKLDSFAVEYESESRLRATAEQQLKEEQSKKVVAKKTKVFNLWWLLFVGYVLGWQFPPSKLIHKVKSFSTKI